MVEEVSRRFLPRNVVMTPLLCTTYVVGGPSDGLVLSGVQPSLHRAEDVAEVGGDHGLG